MEKSTKLGPQYFDNDIPLWAQDLGWVTAEARENHLRTLYREDGLSDYEKECIHEELWGWPQDSDDEEQQDSDDEEEEPATPLTPPPPSPNAPTAPPATPATTLSLNRPALSATPATGVLNAPTAPPAPTQGGNSGGGSHYDSDHGSATDGESNKNGWRSDGEEKKSAVESESSEDEEEQNIEEQGSSGGEIRASYWNTRLIEDNDLNNIAGDFEEGVSSGDSDESSSDESEEDEEDGYTSEDEEGEDWDEDEPDQDWDEGFEYDDVPKESEEKEDGDEGKFRISWSRAAALTGKQNTYIWPLSLLVRE